MNGYDPLTPAASNRARVLLAAAGALLLLGSLVVFAAAGAFRSRARATTTGSPKAATQFHQMAATVQARIARQSRQAAVNSSELAHHEVNDPTDPPPAAQLPAIAAVQRVASRWLRGYLPYEVDELTAAGRRDLIATSGAPLARSLLARPPLIPPTGQRPPQGRPVDLLTTFAHSGRQAQVYVEIAYGPEQIGFYLTLTRGGQYGWLVAAFHA